MANDRNMLIKIIHTGRRYLQLDEETYRQFLHGVTKKNSCVMMSTDELKKVVEVMREKGFTAQKQNFKLRQDNLFKNAQYAKCYSLWQELFKMGGVKNKSIMALNAYLKKICPDFKKNFYINCGEFSIAIETLKSWQDRLAVEQHKKITAEELFNPQIKSEELEYAG